eukprot:comp7536_c0_seq1/m.3194 comp7536_c0_seq1/g.3194  ORF comp7536_c0_seq1/g.3194 comp7536_c0_seq1/m.3194 type:complete len:279 (-) comp7536_c0_seq1:342-1178(-)
MPSRKTTDKGWVCYILREVTGKATYVGATVNFTRRLRQHNGDIRGGARYTRRHKGNWEGVCYVGGFRNQREALQFEWAVKHEAPRHLHGLTGRLTKLQKVLSKAKWTAQAPPAAEISLRVHWLIAEIRPAKFSYPSYVSESFATCVEEDLCGSDEDETEVDCKEDDISEGVMRVHQDILRVEISCSEGINVGGECDESEDDVPLAQHAARMQKHKLQEGRKYSEPTKDRPVNSDGGNRKKKDAGKVGGYFNKRKPGITNTKVKKRANVDTDVISAVTK